MLPPKSLGDVTTDQPSNFTTQDIVSTMRLINREDIASELEATET
jgi:hypothetical protein